jgi:serine phosphatase RsbU (regulator of sigma subunit)/anti-sigma regulatory factor (Ser/Thr protein kinase)
VAVPLHAANGAVMGGLTVMWPTPTDIDDAGRADLEEAAKMVSRAIERLRLTDEEHRLVADLQEHLLALDLRSTRVAVSGAYEPAGEVVHVGGDWYTATALDDGRVAVTVGDVVGHGLPAIVTMSQLRSLTVGAGLTYQDPDRVIQAMNRYADAVPGAATATLAYAVVDVERATVRYSCAGHPYPLLVHPDGSARFLEGARHPPLASPQPSPSAGAGEVPAPPGSVLILYSDGLIERRGESIDDGLQRLAEAAAAAGALPIGELCERLLYRMRPRNGYSDDVVVLAVRPVEAAPTRLVQVVPATYSSIAPLRHRLWRWLEQTGADHTVAQDLLLTIGEATTNAIEHGSKNDPERRVTLEVFKHTTHITGTVSDTGRWVGDTAASWRQASRGRGLTLMHNLSDRVRIVRTANGTRVTVVHHLN